MGDGLKLLCVTDNKTLSDLIFKEAERLDWNAEAALGINEFTKTLEGFKPDMLVLDRASLERLIGLRAHRHFPRFGLNIDFERQIAKVAEHKLGLTATELRLLRELAAMDFDVVARDVLEECMVGIEKTKKRALDVHICSLRKKLKPAGLTIESFRRVGYRLNPCRP